MLKLIVGVSRKVGLPSYSSTGASCQIEIELAPSLLEENPQKFRDEIRRAYAAARRAVDDDLAPWESPAVAGESWRKFENSPFDGMPRSMTRVDRLNRRATPRQLQALAALGRERQIDIDELLASLGVDRPESLSVAQASDLIGRLRAGPAF